MSIYRDKRSPFFRYDFQIDGYRFSGSTKLKNERDARAFEAAKKAEAELAVAELTRTNSQPLTIERAATRWWNEHGRHLSDQKLKPRLDWLVAAIGAKTPLHAISDDTVSRLVEARRLDVRRSGFDDDGKQLFREITARTVNMTTVSLLRRVMRRARDNWSAAIVREPTWKKHLLKEKKFRIRELAPSEERALDAVEDVDFAELRRFAIITGLRRGNLLLTWPQVDFEAAVIRVVTKGGEPRTLPLTKEAYAILWRQRGRHPEFVFTYVCKKSRRIPKGKMLRIKGQRYPITYSGFGSNRRKWKAAGIDARIHDLRHTAGTRTLRATGNLKAAQKLLGHSDIAITAKFYADASLEDLREAMEKTAAMTPTERPALPDLKQEDGEP